MTDNIIIKKAETDDEIRGKALVHYTAWKEAYSGIIDQAFLDNINLEQYTETAYKFRDNTIIAKKDDQVIGFSEFYTKYRGEDLDDTSEVGGLYILRSYYGQGLGYNLMQHALLELKDTPRTAVWVLKDNLRAINFYKKCGFIPDNTEKTLILGTPIKEIRMILEKKNNN